MMDKRPLIAVVGLDGIFPGALNLQTFWRNIVDGADQSRPVPASRWIAPREDRLTTILAPDRPYSDHACLITDFDFDPAAFSLDADLTRHLDPVHQLTLTAGKRAVNACKTADVDSARVDTILAAIALPTDSASAFSRKLLGRAIEERLFKRDTPQPLTISRNEALASRVDGLPAALLAVERGFGGNCFTLDAACASSLYALKLSCDSLLAGHADMVVTGGVSRPECLYTQTGFSQLQALSPSGRCAPFDHRADGLVVGEGVGILVLKRLADAIAQGDTIWGVIHGIGLSNDMRGNLLAPESRGQVRAMQAAYRAAGWQPTDVDLIECHGTGTRAGDTTEIESMLALWASKDAVPQSCPIGSVKSQIGHLLTAAGAAGMIKTLLAMRHQTLPPSIHFDHAPPDSPLTGSPFRVQTAPAEWTPRAAGLPRRAAVSAFGFGGINAHALFEEWPAETKVDKTVASIPEIRLQHPPEAVAIVGMAVHAGSLDGLKAFETAVFQGQSAIGRRPSGRWKGADTTFASALKGADPHGAFIDALQVGIGEFQIPPNEIDRILPQQLLALKTGAAALTDAGLALREAREAMGVVVGISFDFEATNFHLRWQLFPAVQAWRERYALPTSGEALDGWLAELRDACGPPLTAPRVMGALGGIVASRMAREFRFGGPSFVVSADAASGIQALQVAVDRIQQGDAETMLVTAVDLGGEGRNVVRRDSMLPLSRQNHVHPFDASADGSLPGDAAVALVLKPLSLARAQKDRIYATIQGIGSAGGDSPASGHVSKSTYTRSLQRCFARSAIPEKTPIAYVEAHGGAQPELDRVELDALGTFFNGPVHSSVAERAIALGSVKAICGHTGAADGLLALAKTALCLHHRTLPPLPGFTRMHPSIDFEMPFHIPRQSQPWYRNREDGPRMALSSTVTMDGTCAHVLLQEHETVESSTTIFCQPTTNRDTVGLFVVSGNSTERLMAGLTDLESHLSAADRLPITAVARQWYQAQAPDAAHGLAMALLLKGESDRSAILARARRAVECGQPDPLDRQVCYRSDPLGPKARIAMVYPGSGNHYLGMGRDLALHFPDIVAGMDRGTARLLTQMRPWSLMPWGRDWSQGWQPRAERQLKSDILNMIFGQVVYGGLMTQILKRFAVPTNAIIGYSLGESAALFAHGVWADRGDMLARMQATDLFSTQLAGPCHALRQAWQIPAGEAVDWTVAVVNRAADQVRQVIGKRSRVRLLIVNSPDECVIGGTRMAVEEAISALNCQAVFLDGVVTVHCDAARPVAKAYRDLHHFPTTPRSGLTVYSCSWAKAYDVTADAIADSIERQAVAGFDFPKTIQQAYADGIRIFVEAGPRASCSRMIDRILDGRPHLAVAANHSADDEWTGLLRCLAHLTVERVPLDLQPIYDDRETTVPIPRHGATATVRVTVGGQAIAPRLPMAPKPSPPLSSAKAPDAVAPQANPIPAPPTPPDNVAPARHGAPLWETLMDTAEQNMTATAGAHEQFLALSNQLSRSFADAFELQNRLLGLGARVANGGDACNGTHWVPPPGEQPEAPSFAETPAPPTPAVAFDRDMCMQFAIGSVGRMLGPAFDVVDTYRVRVRLPDEPLMLVDRILSVHGEMLSMGSGRVVTEHDVLPGAWYLDGDRAPVCISVEAGQADLFLSAYLGIDHQVKGQRAYRLLDAEITFHRGLPRPGETIRYDIAIDRFVRQGDTWMFFFRFEGFIGDDHLITMQDGCAGFFTEAEVENSGGIILTEPERRPTAGACPQGWRPMVPMARESYTDDQVEALRRGDLAGCFGERFTGIALAPSLWLPDGRMRLIHRILDLDPQGGRYGLGLIRAEADIHPDDWFLTCHFVDDMVMPGTLMYECCAHTLRVFLQRMGWVTDKPGVCYEPVIGSPARLKCRGPVTPKTAHVHYEIQISEIGIAPEPYVIADAHMSADGRPIVFFKGMSMKMTGVSMADIEALWQRQASRPWQPPIAPSTTRCYDRDSILAFAVGNPSEAFGEPYRVFDRQRTIARLPGPPYCFMDRVTRVEPPPWELKADGWVTAEYDVPPGEWYFAADHSGVMPFCVLLEIALQPCGWLAAYAGSALHSQQDLKFRNLGGSGILHRPVIPGIGTLTLRCRMTKVSEAAEMIIENFEFEVLASGEPVYTGDTYFGFFSAQALGQQKGLGRADRLVQALAEYASTNVGGESLPGLAPLTPADAERLPTSTDRLTLPGKALLMVDRIDAYLPHGGGAGLGYIRGSKRVDPEEWFFKAHFFQDPVCPGSLGVESFLQLLKTVAIKRWPERIATHRFRLSQGSRHNWSYRGQIIQKNKMVTVEAVITAIQDGVAPVMRADGLLWVDGLPIYKMENFELALVPVAQDTPS